MNTSSESICEINRISYSKGRALAIYELVTKLVTTIDVCEVDVIKVSKIVENKRLINVGIHNYQAEMKTTLGNFFEDIFNNISCVFKEASDVSEIFQYPTSVFYEGITIEHDGHYVVNVFLNSVTFLK